MFDELRKATESSKRFVDEFAVGKCNVCDPDVNYQCEFCVGLSIMATMSQEVPKLLAAFDALADALKEIARTEKLSDDMTLVVHGHSAQKIAREALAAILGTNAVRSDGNGGNECVS